MSWLDPIRPDAWRETYFNWRGRLNRKQAGIAGLALVVFFQAIAIASLLLVLLLPFAGFYVLGFLPVLANIPLSAIAAKRAHDFGERARIPIVLIVLASAVQMAPLGLIPTTFLFGAFVFIAIILVPFIWRLAFTPSDMMTNEFGPAPQNS